MISRYALASLTALVCLASASAAQEQASSLWNHNGSVMGLYADGASRAFRYHQPRVGMQQEGVGPGTVLFDGVKSGSTYSGTAYVFSSRCGALAYAVSGAVSDDERQITLYGNAPSRLDSGCRTAALRQDVLVFAFLQSLAPPPPPLVYGERIESGRDQAALDRQQQEQRLRELREQAAQRAREAQDEQDRADRARRAREQEEARLSELRTFSSHRDACRQYRISACDTALLSPRATVQDRQDLAAWRATAVQYMADFNSCRSGSTAACDAALGSSAASAADRAMLQDWRTAASPINAALAYVTRTATTIGTTIRDLPDAVRNLPASTQLTGGLAALLALALAVMLCRQRGASTDPMPAPTTGKGTPAETVRPAAERASSFAGEAAAMPIFRPTNAGFSSSTRAVGVPVAPLPAVSQTREPETSGPPAFSMADVRPIAAVLGNAPVFVLCYLLFMIPTYWLPYLGSNSLLLNSAGAAAGAGLSPAFFLHLGALVVLVLLTVARGIVVQKTALAVLPVLALVFDLVPGLSSVPLVPTVMHLAAVIVGVTAQKA